MKISKKELEKIIKEELQKEIFGFGKKKSEITTELPNVKTNILSRLIFLKAYKKPMDDLLKKFPELNKVKDKSFSELNKIYGDLAKKEKEQRIADEKAAKARQSSYQVPSYRDPNEPSLEKIVQDFRKAEAEREAELRRSLNNPYPDRIPEKPQRDTSMDKEYPSGRRPGMTERKNK